jgi:hypothetical protein
MAKGAAREPDPLPVQPREFARLVASARGEEEREALLTRIREAFHGRARRTRADRNLFESRLLAFIETPARRRDLTLPLHFSHMDAWAELLELRPASFARLLRSFLRSSDRRLRGEAAEYLAWLAFDQDTSTILNLLRSTDGLIVGKAASGARSAAGWKFASPSYRKRLFEGIARVVLGEQRISLASEELRCIPESLVALDPRGALQLLRSDRCLRADNPLLDSIVLELVSLSGGIPAHQWRPIHSEALWPIFEQVRSRPMRGRAAEGRGILIANLLNLTADADPARTRHEANALLKSTPRTQTGIKRVLREAVLRCEDVPNPLKLWAWMDRNPGCLPKPAEQRMRAFELSQHMMSDGIIGYFDNAGECWRDALAGLKLLKLTREAAQLEEIARALGPKAKLARRDRKGNDGTSPAAAKQLKRLCDAFDARADGIATALERFMAADPALFRRVAK